MSSMSKSSGKNFRCYISSVVNPECCADCSCATAKHLQDNGVAQQQAGKLQDLMIAPLHRGQKWLAI